MRLLIATIHKKEHGFSLIEFLIAFTVLLIMLTAAVPLFLHITEGTQSNRARMHATVIAQEVMEEVKRLPYEAFDAEGNLITDDETVEQLGTHPGGNPFGSVPKVQSRFDARGVEYVVRTTIDWVADPASPHGEGIDFKRINVTVEAPGFFSGNVTLAGNVHSWVAKEGEKRIFEAGHLNVMVMTSSGVSCPNLHVEIKKFDSNYDPWAFDLAKTQSKYASTDGNALFGIIPEGDYKAKVELPPDMMVRPDVWAEIVQDLDENYSFYRVVDSSDNHPDHPGPYGSGYYIQDHALVSNWESSEVIFDKINKPSYLELELRDISDGALFEGDLNSLSLHTPFRPPISKSNLSGHGGQFNKNFLGPLWPDLDEGLYYSFKSISVENGHPFLLRTYNNSNPQTFGDEWNRRFNNPDETIKLVIWVGEFMEIIANDKTGFAAMNPPGSYDLGYPETGGLFIIKNNFTQPSSHKITLVDGAILLIDNSEEEAFIMGISARFEGNGKIFVKNDMHMENNSAVLGDVQVFVGGSFSKVDNATDGGRVQYNFPGFLP